MATLASTNSAVEHIDASEPSQIFYNVPPHDGAAPVIINPGAADPTPLRAAQPKRYMLIALGALGVIIIGLLVFLLIKNRSANVRTNEQETLVQTEQPRDEEQVATSPATGGQPEGVTTPHDWQQQYFGAETCNTAAACGDGADPDRDGLDNIEEYTLQTDPNNPDSDGDGLADGDEAHVFGGNPLNQRTAQDPKYTDEDNAKGGYNPADGKKYSDDAINQVKVKMKQYGLHQPTIGNIGENLLIKYDFVESGDATAAPAATLPESLDRSPQATLDRDIQRLGTVRKIGVALVAYKEAQRTFPQATEFLDMASKVKGYLTVATNPVDPVNIAPYIYTYQVSQTGLDFTITYFSESQNQLIKFTAPDAEKSATQENAGLNDDQRIRDLETIKSALLIYSEAHRPVSATVNYVFPTVDAYKTELVPSYISSVPKDPASNKDYEYQVSAAFDSFTLKTILENPPSGSTGYMCNQEECRNY